MSKKYKRNNIRSIWKHDDIKIVFSKPEIQASESVVHVKDVNDILFYYYTMKVYRKTNKNWKKNLFPLPGIRRHCSVSKKWPRSC